MSGLSAEESGGLPTGAACVHQGKAAPVHPFTGEDPKCRLDDWSQC